MHNGEATPGRGGRRPGAGCRFETRGPPTYLVGMSVLRSLSRDITGVAESVRPAVLHIQTLRAGRPGVGTGSGFLCGPDGIALTNHHCATRTRSSEPSRRTQTPLRLELT